MGQVHATGDGDDVKVLVVAENKAEEPFAERMVRTLPQFVPSIINTIAHSLNTHPAPYTARSMTWRELFDGVQLEPEVRAYIEALERAVFVEQP